MRFSGVPFILYASSFDSLHARGCRKDPKFAQRIGYIHILFLDAALSTILCFLYNIQSLKVLRIKYLRMRHVSLSIISIIKVQFLILHLVILILSNFYQHVIKVFFISKNINYIVSCFFFFFESR